ncbi:hypothetical protein LCGC14_0373480 [marine sediment metagenome]|uniref:YspA cpYpsA-related SLOG domain-containing protein n=1 Tax=marine sediment metagenome TaxID=412755 RepID=A0A0F9WD44_9ZZZZ
MDKIIVAGGRDFDDYFMVCLTLERRFAINDEIVSGGAKGADALGERYAHEQATNFRRFPADWDRYGKGAGWRRNKEMAEYADVLIAFWDGKSTGTRSMIHLALKHGLEVHVYRYGPKT